MAKTATSATKTDINEAADVLRVSIDQLYNRIIEEEGADDVDGTTNPLYDAVTLLHEAASIYVEGKE